MCVLYPTGIGIPIVNVFISSPLKYIFVAHFCGTTLQAVTKIFNLYTNFILHSAYLFFVTFTLVLYIPVGRGA